MSPNWTTVLMQKILRITMYIKYNELCMNTKTNKNEKQCHELWLLQPSFYVNSNNVVKDGGLEINCISVTTLKNERCKDMYEM